MSTGKQYNKADTILRLLDPKDDDNTIHRNVAKFYHLTSALHQEDLNFFFKGLSI